MWLPLWFSCTSEAHTEQAAPSSDVAHVGPNFVSWNRLDRTFWGDLKWNFKPHNLEHSWQVLVVGYCFIFPVCDWKPEADTFLNPWECKLRHKQVLWKFLSCGSASSFSCWNSTSNSTCLLVLKRILFGFDPGLPPAPSTFLHSSPSSEKQVPRCSGPPRQCLRAQVVLSDVQTGFSAQLRGDKDPRFFRECPAVVQGAPHLLTPF